MMRVLLINGVCGIRSTGRICTDIAEKLAADGHEVKIAYGREAVPEKYKKYAVNIETSFGVKVHGLKARLFDSAGFGSKNSTLKFIEWIKDYNPDVIHLHNLHGYYINIEILFNFLRTFNKKIIWTLHDCWAFSGHSALCDAVDCTKWKTGCHNCPQLKEYPKSFIDKSKNNWEKKRTLLAGIKNLSIVTPSNWLASFVKESFLGKYPIEVIPNGIDTNQFYPTNNNFKALHKIEDKYMILGVASTWNTLKGYFDFLELSKKLDKECCLVMVGLSKKQLKERPANIIGIERTNSVKELAEIYSSADIFLNLTYCDNYPTVHLEAVCCGTPVISYATGGCNESMLGFGDTVKKGDLDKVIEKINEYRFGQTPIPNFSKSLADNNTAISRYVKLYSAQNKPDLIHRS